MFEKEADEYIKTNNLEWELECHRTSPIGEVKQAFLAGAEFGYNKAKEEMQEQGLALQSDMDKTIEQNIQLKKELEKANEWHYVKDGDLPKNGEKNILLYCKEHFYTTSYVTAGYFEEDVFYNDCDMEEDVIAWKEIVLP